MVTFSHYKADNVMNSNLIFITASLSIKFVKSKSESKVLDEQRVMKWKLCSRVVSC